MEARRTLAVQLSRRRPATALLALAAWASLVGSGCGDDPAARGMVTANPERTFAPVVWVHPREPFRPMGASWMLARSALWFADDEGCPDRKVAVGRRLAGQQDEVTDWIAIQGLGHGPAYWREAVKERCDEKREAYRYYANQRTRPGEDGPDRAPGLQPGEGYYLDLMDWARQGPSHGTEGHRQAPVSVPAYVERDAVDIDGDAGLRLTYWLLFGMSEPRGPEGRVAAMAHEGDWERVEILLRGDDGRYEPVAVHLPASDGRRRKVSWGRLRLSSGNPDAPRRATHPVLFAARGSHSLYAQAGRHERSGALDGGRTAAVRDVAVGGCKRCARWETWRALKSAPAQQWYGFGGAWGEPGPTDATTGPLGPNDGNWAKGTPRDDYLRSRRHE